MPEAHSVTFGEMRSALEGLYPERCQPCHKVAVNTAELAIAVLADEITFDQAKDTANKQAHDIGQSCLQGVWPGDLYVGGIQCGYGPDYTIVDI